MKTGKIELWAKMAKDIVPGDYILEIGPVKGVPTLKQVEGIWDHDAHMRWPAYRSFHFTDKDGTSIDSEQLTIVAVFTGE